MKVVIISHTAHHKNNNGKIVGWGPTVKELNYLSTICSELVHVATFHNEKAPKSGLPYNDKVKFVPIKPSGGKNLLQKLTVILTAPTNLYIIHKECKNADYIQFRSPTGIGMYVLPYLKYINKNNYWVKYAGNWIAQKLPIGNRIQRWCLKKMLPLKNIVTVNGKWKGEKNNIIAFENPCLEEKERENGKAVVLKKNLNNKINFCFVGALNRHKGVHLILEALKNIKTNKIEVFHFIGDGPDRKEFEKLVKNIKVKIIFHGYLNKDDINKIYAKSHFVVLPSISEGFPKVIGEGMNFGCVPIVSDVSAIGQYIEHSKNGFLIDPLNVDTLVSIFEESLKIDTTLFKEMQKINYKLAEKFTYEYFIKRIKKEIFI